MQDEYTFPSYKSAVEFILYWKNLPKTRYFEIFANILISYCLKVIHIDKIPPIIKQQTRTSKLCWKFGWISERSTISSGSSCRLILANSIFHDSDSFTFHGFCISVLCSVIFSLPFWSFSGVNTLMSILCFCFLHNIQFTYCKYL